MKIRRSFAMWCSFLLLSAVLVAGYWAGKEKKGSANSFVCSEQKPWANV